MRFALGLILAFSFSVSAYAANPGLDRNKLDQGYIKGVATNAVEDLNAMGLALVCVWSNSFDEMSGYMNSVLRIVLKEVPARVSMPTHPDSGRVCVMLDKSHN